MKEKEAKFQVVIEKETAMTADDRKKRAQLMKEAEPLWLTDKFVDYPGSVLAISFAFLFVLAFISQSADLFA